MRGVIAFLVLLAFVATVSGIPLRGEFGSSLPQARSTQSELSGPLISFLQQHQRAYQSQSNQAPSQQAQQAAESTVPQGASEAASGDVLSALEHTPGHNALVQTGQQAQVSEGEEFGPCKTCVFVLERIKKGSNMLLPAICSELYHKYPDAYALCHQVLNALSINGNNVRYWLFEGCFKYEIYQSKEWIKPCPSHVMCSVLKDLSAQPFCPALPMENPFADAAAGGE